MTLKADGTNGILQQYDYQVSTTGFSYTFAAGTTVLVMNPAGTLATGTITMPASPADGMTITFSSTQTITALTVNANTGQSIVSAATVLPARQATTYVYRLSNTTWYPMSTVATNVPVAPAGGSIITSGTSQASTSGTSIDFTSLPSWIKRITVMFSGVSTNSTSNYLVQLITGASTVVNTGYVSAVTFGNGGAATATSTAGFIVRGGVSATDSVSGMIFIGNITGNTWVETGNLNGSSAGQFNASAGTVALAAVLTGVRITSVTPDTFDAGSINILYE